MPKTVNIFLAVQISHGFRSLQFFSVALVHFSDQNGNSQTPT